MGVEGLELPINSRTEAVGETVKVAVGEQFPPLKQATAPVGSPPNDNVTGPLEVDGGSRLTVIVLKLLAP